MRRLLPPLRVAAALGLVALGVVTSAGAATPTSRPFRDLVGVNVKFAQGESPRDLFLLKELGVRWVRDTVDWPTIEPTAGKYVPFPQAFRDRLAFYKANDIGIVFGLWYDNLAAYPNTPDDKSRSTDAAAYGRYAAEITRQLRASGVRFAIELYNEPHNSLKDLGGAWNGEPPCAWLDHYVDMVRAAVTSAKAVDPAVRLLAGDDMWVLQSRFLERGLPRNLDGLTAHPYVKDRPERAAVEQDTSWARPFTLVDADASFASAVRRLRSAATESLGRTPSIWITEWGWPVDCDIAGRKLDEATLAAFVPRAYLAAADAGVETLLWFSLQDSVDGAMGLTTNDGRRRASFDALRTMTQQLGDCRELEHLLGADHPTVGVQVYRLRDGAKTTLVAWNIDGTSTARLVGAGDGVQIVDVVGKPLVASQPLTLSPSPIYIGSIAGDVRIESIIDAGAKPTFLFP